MRKRIVEQIEKSITVKQALLADSSAIAEIERIAEAATGVFEKGGKLLIAGNGGSAADAQHVAGELVNRFNFDRPPLPAVALTTDTSVLTAIGNDSSYEFVFSRQLEALGKKCDIFLAISTSGNAENIINALKICGEKGIISAGLTGRDGGAMLKLCDYCVRVPADKTPIIQESHIMICHILCWFIEQRIFGS